MCAKCSLKPGLLHVMWFNARLLWESTVLDPEALDITAGYKGVSKLERMESQAKIWLFIDWLHWLISLIDITLWKMSRGNFTRTKHSKTLAFGADTLISVIFIGSWFYKRTISLEIRVGRCLTWVWLFPLLDGWQTSLMNLSISVLYSTVPRRGLGIHHN